MIIIFLLLRVKVFTARMARAGYVRHRFRLAWCSFVAAMGSIFGRSLLQAWVPDHRPVLSREDAREVYDNFARKRHHTAGKDTAGGYGGPAVKAMLSIADFEGAESVVDYGCGQGKLAELLLQEHGRLHWQGFDQSPEMLHLARSRLAPFGDRAQCQLVGDGDPATALAAIPAASIDRFVSTYCLDLMSEDDMFAVIDGAARCLRPGTGKLVLAGITWGYRRSVFTCLTTAIWEVLYRFARKVVGGCRPQNLEPYLLQRGWQITQKVVTLPDGYPWMASEVVVASPPSATSGSKKSR